MLDDLQAADTPSILLLRFLAAQLGDMAVVVIGTYRDVVLTPDHPLIAAIAELGREPNTRRLTLSGLDVEAVGRVMAAAGAQTLTDGVVAAVWRGSGGNPLFVGEAVRLLAAEGRLGDAADARSVRVAVPASVRAVIRRRIERLDPATVAMLTDAAVLGPEFGVDVLRAVQAEPDTSLADRWTRRSRPGSSYRSPVRRALPIRARPRPRVPLRRAPRRPARTAPWPGRGRARSTLCPIPRRPPCRACVSRRCQAATPAGADAADGAPGRARAVDYARRAGDRAASALAYEEAVRLYRNALALVDESEHAGTLADRAPPLAR